MTKKKREILFLVLKFVVITASYIYIYHKLKDVDFQHIKVDDLSAFVYLFFAFLLMFVNWGIEAYKWHFLIQKVQRISYFDAIKNVFVGIVFGLFTPNRIGEIGGRAAYLNKSNKFKGVLVAGVGSFAQMTVTVVLGILGIAFLFFIVNSFEVKYSFSVVLPVVLIVLSILMCLFFFNLGFVADFAKKIKLSAKVISKLEYLRSISQKKLLIVLFISLLRYFVFVFQFYLLLYFFDVKIDFFIAIAGIFTVFLLINILPNVVVADMGIRGSVSLFILGQLDTNLQGILSASILLWMINILLPAIVGQFFIIKTKQTEVI